MRDLELGRLVRALRRRRGWRQEDCALRARVHRSTWSRLERGEIARMSIEVLRRCLAVLEVRLDLVPRWRGADVDRVLDAGHADLQAAWKERLEAWGWLVRAEVSFSRYGERGRIDLLAWHPGQHILVVIEIKTEIVNVQELLGGLDVKARLAPYVARDLGLGAPRLVVPMLLIADRTASRERVGRLATLFGSFTLRGRAAGSWLRRPDGAVEGLLVFSELRPAHGGSVKDVASHRVRARTAPASVAASRQRSSEPARAP